MAGSSSTSRASKRKPQVSQKRVMTVLASLVATMTLSAAALLVLEDGSATSALPMPAAAISSTDMRSLLQPGPALQRAPWDYIIIYDSGDAAASAATLAEGSTQGEDPHAGQALRLPAPFHFVIDSARSTPGALDGELEVTSRWKSQEYGTPHLGWPDTRYYHLYPKYQQGISRAIAVCLIGDVTRGSVSTAQRQTLIELLRELTSEAQIRPENIIFQWELVPNSDHATPAQKAFAVQIRRALD